MSSTFPAIPGYAGPWSLREFLQRYLFLQLRFEASPGASLAPSGERIIFVRPTGGFVVVVYVSLGAPPPPVAVAPSAGRECRSRLSSTPLSGRPLTFSVLQHLFWDSFLDQIGLAFTSFITSWCPVVVQFEPTGGGIQVLGPPLKNAVFRLPKTRRCTKREGPRKIPRVENSAARQRRQEQGQEQQREERSLRGTSPLVASLYRLNVSRLPLIEMPPQRTFAEHNCCVNPMLASLWQEHHSGAFSSAAAVADANSGTTTGAGAARMSQKCCSVALRDVLVPCPDECCALAVATDLVGLVFPYTLSPSCNNATSRRDSVERYLTHVLHCVLGSVCRMNFRGAAIKHAGFLEERSLSTHGPHHHHHHSFRSGFWNHNEDQVKRDNASATVPVSEFTAPESLVISYIRSLFERMWWRPPHSMERVSFWGDTAVLTKLCCVALDWLRCGRHELFPISHFLHGVSVSRIPWLRGFYTKGQGQRRRSMIQQRVFLQLVFFLFQHVVPFAVRRSFHVTWSSKNPNAFVFIPRPVWIRLARCEMQRVCIPRRIRASAKANVKQRVVYLPMALQRATSREVLQMVSPPSNAGTNSLPPQLYSSISFLLDRRKLRPIARVRQANARLLCKIADGLRLPPLCRGKVNMTTPTKMRSSPNSTVLREALRCLIAGLEEQRVESGLLRLTNASHQNEYAEMRSFVEGSRRFRDCPSLVQNSASLSSMLPQEGVVVSMVRGDAARCYDSLPQAAVMDVVERLVSHDLYYTLRLTAVVPLPCGGRRAAGNLEGRGLSTMGEGVLGSETLLYQRERVQTVSGKSLQDGVLLGIPKGWIVWEESAPCVGSVIRGEDVRATLRQHLQGHLVEVDGKLYIQRIGINQGSAVAMLLCDTLLEAVDVSLSGILSQHEEPSLLLRRVDDVLVVTLSHVAASRCHAALCCGWPDVGFLCQSEKLQYTTMTPVPWCGLLWNPETLELGVEWRRLAPLLPHIAVRPRTGGEVLLCSVRFMSILSLRTPLTVLCRRINTKARVLQTLYELALLWSRFVLHKMVENAAFIRPHVCVLLKPLYLAVAALRRLVWRHKRSLERMGSFCDVTDDDTRLCLLVALHRTLQERLPWMVARMRHVSHRNKSFALLLLSVTRRKMQGALSVRKTPVRAVDASAALTAFSACSEMGSDDAAALLLAEGHDTITTRALAAVRFTAFHGFA